MLSNAPTFELCKIKHHSKNGRQSCYMSCFLSVIYSMKSVTAKLDSIEGIEKYPWGKLLADLHEAARECSKNQEAMNNFFMYRDGRQLLKILEKHTTASKDGTAHIDETFQMFNNEMQLHSKAVFVYIADIKEVSYPWSDDLTGIMNSNWEFSEDGCLLQREEQNGKNVFQQIRVPFDITTSYGLLCPSSQGRIENPGDVLFESVKVNLVSVQLGDQGEYRAVSASNFSYRLPKSLKSGYTFHGIILAKIPNQRGIGHYITLVPHRSKEGMAVRGMNWYLIDDLISEPPFCVENLVTVDETDDTILRIEFPREYERFKFAEYTLDYIIYSHSPEKEISENRLTENISSASEDIENMQADTQNGDLLLSPTESPGGHGILMELQYNEKIFEEMHFSLHERDFFRSILSQIPANDNCEAHLCIGVCNISRFANDIRCYCSRHGIQQTDFMNKENVKQCFLASSLGLEHLKFQMIPLNKQNAEENRNALIALCSEYRYKTDDTTVANYKKEAEQNTHPLQHQNFEQFACLILSERLAFGRARYRHGRYMDSLWKKFVDTIFGFVNESEINNGDIEIESEEVDINHEDDKIATTMDSIDDGPLGDSTLTRDMRILNVDCGQSNPENNENGGDCHADSSTNNQAEHGNTQGEKGDDSGAQRFVLRKRSLQSSFSSPSAAKYSNSYTSKKRRKSKRRKLNTYEQIREAVVSTSSSSGSTERLIKQDTFESVKQFLVSIQADALDTSQFHKLCEEFDVSLDDDKESSLIEYACTHERVISVSGAELTEAIEEDFKTIGANLLDLILRLKINQLGYCTSVEQIMVDCVRDLSEDNLIEHQWIFNSEHVLIPIDNCLAVLSNPVSILTDKYFGNGSGALNEAPFTIFITGPETDQMESAIEIIKMWLIKLSMTWCSKRFENDMRTCIEATCCCLQQAKDCAATCYEVKNSLALHWWLNETDTIMQYIQFYKNDDHLSITMSAEDKALAITQEYKTLLVDYMSINSEILRPGQSLIIPSEYDVSPDTPDTDVSAIISPLVAKAEIVDSAYCFKDSQGKYTRSLGKALRTTSYVRKDEIIAYFKGTLSDVTTYKINNQEGKGGYAIHINNLTVLDCFDHKDTCIASMANDPRNCMDPIAKHVPICNSKLRCNPQGTLNKMACIVANVNIRPGQEIFINYGRSFFNNFT